MCGIIAYLGHRKAATVLVKGLKRLEYRGYDSAGVGLVRRADEGKDAGPVDGDASARYKLNIVKKIGKVANLEAALESYYSATSSSSSSSSSSAAPYANLGIAHTRWATHGVPSDENSHPHANMSVSMAIVHNGIVENYQSLKAMLLKKGYTFRSDTDTEVITHLIDDVKKMTKVSLPEAVRLALTQVEGTFGIAVCCDSNPDLLIGARKGSPLIIGVGKDEYFLASDASAIIEYTSNVIYLDDGDVCILSRKEGHQIHNLDKVKILRSIIKLEMDRSEIEKGGHKFFMIKEILDQPRALLNCIRGRINMAKNEIKLGGLTGGKSNAWAALLKAKRLVICACGTSWHAGLVGEYLIEELAGVPVEVE